MSALCFVSASCLRIGSAEEEIWSERGSLPWSSSASMLVILPFLTVTRTWALPYWVSTAPPVAVFDELEPLDADEVGVAVARRAGGACGWKASTPAVPATVAVRTREDRRMAGLRGVRRRRTRSVPAAPARRRARAPRRAGGPARRGRRG